MKEIRDILWMMAVAVLTGCSAGEFTPTAEESVEVSLAFSMPTAGAMTRMGSDVVQLSAADYRGLQNIRIIPFKTEGTIQRGDSPFLFVVNGNEEARVDNKLWYYYDKCTILSGSASALVYARAAQADESRGEAYYGSLTHAVNNIPSEIRFEPTPIRPVVAADEKAVSLAQYMTDIANTAGWAATTDARLLALYKNFIVEDNEKNHGVMAGSSASIRAFVNQLYGEVGTSDNTTLAAAIRASIAARATVTDGRVTALDASLSDYPANVGLPDGAAALRWEYGRFVPQTTTTTQVAITSVTRFAYPAELYYHTNSRLYTTSNKVEQADYSSSADWAALMDSKEMALQPVNRNTKSAAIVSPLQYGVAQLCVQLDALTADRLADADGKAVAVSPASFPMTGIIVGGQYPVGFDFTPEAATAKNEVAETAQRFVYDAQVKTRQMADGTRDYFYMGTTAASAPTHTLVLQTYEGDAVVVVMELENNTGSQFRGVDGIVYPGTKFYLIGKVEPAGYDTSASAADTAVGRVFTQDHTTTLHVKANSLARAYNVMPDLLSPRLEIGVELVPGWDVTPPTNVEL